MKEHFKAINLENHLIMIEFFSDNHGKEINLRGEMQYPKGADADLAALIMHASCEGGSDEQILTQLRHMKARSKAICHNLPELVDSLEKSKAENGSQDYLIHKVEESMSYRPHNPTTSARKERERMAQDAKLTFPHRFPLPVMSGLKIAASKLYSNIFHKDDPDVQRFSAPEPGDF